MKLFNNIESSVLCNGISSAVIVVMMVTHSRSGTCDCVLVWGISWLSSGGEDAFLIK